LYEIKPTIDISADDEFAFIKSCQYGRLDVAKWLYKIKPTIIINNINNITNITNITNQIMIKWLITLNSDITYKIIDGIYILYKRIKTIKIDNIVFNDKCCVCLEEPNCLTECKHEMCLECVDRLKEYICPLCRKLFDFCYIK